VWAGKFNKETKHLLLELGAGFSFVVRQKGLQIDNDGFYNTFLNARNNCFIDGTINAVKLI